MAATPGMHPPIIRRPSALLKVVALLTSTGLASAGWSGRSWATYGWS